MTLSSDGSDKAIQNNSPISQVIPGRLYFTSYTSSAPKKDVKTLYINVDEQVHYDAFYDDFGPLNLSVLYRFCQSLNALLEVQRPNKRIFLYTSMCPENRVNAVYLIASYMIIYHNLTAEQAYLRLQTAEPPAFIGFRDAAMGPPSYLLHVQHVIQGIEKALKFKWLDFDVFDPDEYEFFERVENGDLNWIIPEKILSFCGPHERSYVENGYPFHACDVYFDYFRSINVTAIIRLNKKIYDSKRFTDAGFEHHDLFFIDGSTPSDEIILRFIQIVDSTKGAVAVHCKAGLGRTGTLIACWMMKHFRLTAPQCMAWLRVCRPGSVIGPQQHFLIDKQSWCWRLGRDKKITKDEYNDKDRNKTADGHNNSNNNAIRNAASEAMKEETAIDERGRSQGDRLYQIKANRQSRLHNRQIRRNDVPITHGSAPAFILPGGFKGSSEKQRDACQFHSATTPIKQLKLMSTTAGINRTTNTNHIPTTSTESLTKTKPSLELSKNYSPKNMTYGKKNQSGMEQQQNDDKGIGGGALAGRAATIKLPIQKVSVSSSDNQGLFMTQKSKNNNTTLRSNGTHRKHLSTSRLLKPYMPAVAGHQAFNEYISAPSKNSNDRVTFQLGIASKSNDPRHTSSATTYFGRALNRQYARINSHSGGLQPSTSSSQIGSSPSGEQNQQLNSPVEGGSLNHQTHCKYELRPRNQLQLPSRYLGTDISGTTTTTAWTNEPHQKGGGNTSPFAFSRYHKGSRSSTAILSSRL